jgi:hypothetical protein
MTRLVLGGNEAEHVELRFNLPQGTVTLPRFHVQQAYAAVSMLSNAAGD